MALQHPNIISYIDSDTESPLRIDIYMEFCDQGDLTNVISTLMERREGYALPQGFILHNKIVVDRRRWQLYDSRDFVWELLKQLASALHYCHDGLVGRKILHRDIKPSNGLHLSGKTS